MQKLWPFVEEGRIVLIAFEQKGARGAQLIAGAKVFRHSADEKRWLEARRSQREAVW
jgi:hypothetical protein